MITLPSLSQFKQSLTTVVRQNKGLRGFYDCLTGSILGNDDYSLLESLLLPDRRLKSNHYKHLTANGGIFRESLQYPIL